jgi:hypothetical protein
MDQLDVLFETKIDLRLNRSQLTDVPSVLSKHQQR